MSSSFRFLPQLRHFIFTGENIAAKSKDGLFVPGIIEETLSKERALCKGSSNWKLNCTKIYNLASIVLQQVTECIPELANQNKGMEMLDSLKYAAGMQSTHKDAIVLYLAAIVKLPVDKYQKLVSDAYSAIPIICPTSELLFLFIQLLKMMSSSGKPAWGRGLRRAITSWYLRWEPKKLALEMTRNFSRYGWTHRDILKLSHVKLNVFPFGTQVVLSSIFGNTEKTEALYGHLEVASQMIEIMKILKRTELPIIESVEDTPVNSELYHINRLAEKFDQLSLLDINSNALKYREVWLALIDKLDSKSLLNAIEHTTFISCIKVEVPEDCSLSTKFAEALENDRVAREVSPTSVVLAINALHRKARKPLDKRPWKGENAEVTKIRKLSNSRLHSEFNPIVNVLCRLAIKTARRLPKATKHASLFVSTLPQMQNFVYSSSKAKELRGYQVASLIALYLSSGTFEESLTVYTYDTREMEAVNMPLHEDLSYPTVTRILDKDTNNEVDIFGAINHAMRCGDKTVVIVNMTIGQEEVRTAKELCCETANDPESIRVVLCGIQSTLCIEETENSNILVLQGVNHLIPETIRAFHERLF